MYKEYQQTVIKLSSLRKALVECCEQLKESIQNEIEQLSKREEELFYQLDMDLD